MTAFTLTGCYTVLEHPDVSSKDENGFVYNNDVAFYDDCGSCHSETDQAIMSTHPQMYSTYRNQRADDINYHDGYYSQGSFGDYGYYYDIPWWFEVSRSGSGSGDAVTKQNDNTRARNNSGRNETNEREVVRSRNDGGGLNYTSPTRSSNSGSGSSNSSEVTKSSNSGDSSSGSRSNNDAPKSRDNDGSRSSGSGRR